MKNLENMTKKELLEVIDNKEEELSTLRERLASVEELEVYNDIADKVKGMYEYHPDDTSKICLIRDCVRRNLSYGLPHYNLLTEITNVIFNDPATIVFWSDGTKTVVKAENEPFDPEKGLAMAIAKKALGNKGNYYNEFKKWLPKKEEFKSCSECKYKYTHIWQTPCKNCYNNGRPNWEKKND